MDGVEGKGKGEGEGERVFWLANGSWSLLDLTCPGGLALCWRKSRAAESPLEGSKVVCLEWPDSEQLVG